MAGGATDPSTLGRAWPAATEMTESRPPRAPRFGLMAGGDVLGTANVLIVDDYDANVRALEAILLDAGVARVHSVTDPRLVLDAYRASDFDLILLDLHMPGLDGIDVLEQLAAVVPEDEYLPVLMLTADATPEAKQQALAAGAKDFLTKPFDGTEVILRAKNLLETKALHRRMRAHNASLAAQVEAQARRDRRQGDELRAKRARIRKVLEGNAMGMVFQPIADLATGTIVAVEALARFAAEPVRSPNLWFAEAAEVGLGRPLELAAVEAALAQLGDFDPSLAMAINVSPATVTAPEFGELISTAPARRIVIELTEHVEIRDYDVVIQSLAALRAAGVRLAVDDAGAGFATLQHILALQPDIIKLDIALTRGVDRDPVRRALARALVGFASEIGATIMA